MFPSIRNNKGFTVAELVTVLAILSVLAAIAIPLTLSQRNAANESAQRADLTISIAKIQQLLVGYNGVPPTNITISSSGTSWTAIDENLTTVLSSSLTGETQLTGTLWTDGSWCVENFDTETNRTFSYQSDIGEIQKDISCPLEPLGGIGSIITTNELLLPGQITSFTIDTDIDYGLTITWEPVSGATSYTVVVVGQTSTTVTTETAIFAGLTPGATTISIYAIGEQGAGLPTSVNTTVMGATAMELLDARVIQAETDLANALSRIEALETAG
jgi:prepilin-type N-terminal cleavage/methylation domain-containing protein